MPDNDNDMQRMQQEAIRRVREMQSRARNLQQGGNNGSSSQSHSSDVASSRTGTDHQPHPNVTSYGIHHHTSENTQVPHTSGENSSPQNHGQSNESGGAAHSGTSSGPPTPEEQPASMSAGGNLTDIFDSLFKEGDRAIILILLLLLMEDGDTSLVLALMYLII